MNKKSDKVPIKKEKENSALRDSEGGRLLGAVAFLATISGNPEKFRPELFRLRYPSTDKD